MILFQIKSPYGTLAGVGIRSEEKSPVDVYQWDLITFEHNGRTVTTFGRFFPISDF